jgi:hypothetical protein
MGKAYLLRYIFHSEKYILLKLWSMFPKEKKRGLSLLRISLEFNLYKNYAYSERYTKSYLFKILKNTKTKITSRCHHISYGKCILGETKNRM